MLRLPKRTGRPEDTIVSGDVYWAHDWNPRWNQTNSYNLERQKLFSFENPALKQPTPDPAAPFGRGERGPRVRGQIPFRRRSDPRLAPTASAVREPDREPCREPDRERRRGA